MAHTSFGYATGYGRNAKNKTYPTAAEAERYAKRFAKRERSVVQLFAYPGADLLAVITPAGQVDLTWKGCDYL